MDRHVYDQIRFISGMVVIMTLVSLKQTQGRKFGLSFGRDTKL